MAPPIAVFDWSSRGIVSYRYLLPRMMTSPNAVAGVIKRGALVYNQSSFNSIGTYTASSILLCNNYTVYTNYPIINPSVLLIGKTIGFVAYVQQALFQNH